MATASLSTRTRPASRRDTVRSWATSTLEPVGLGPDGGNPRFHELGCRRRSRLGQVIGEERDRRQRRLQVVADASQELALDLVPTPEPDEPVGRVLVDTGVPEGAADEPGVEPEEGGVGLGPGALRRRQADQPRVVAHGHLDRRLDALRMTGRLGRRVTGRRGD